MAASMIREVRMHPVVLFAIVDSYERRKEDAKRVIGTLLGSNENGIVEVTNCFCVPHIESEDEVAMDMEFAKNTLDLHQKVSAKEDVIGWYATGNEVTEYSRLIHTYYSKETPNPIHLTVDTTLQGNHLGIHAYVSTSMGAPGGTLGTMFTPLDLDIVTYDPENVSLNKFKKALWGGDEFVKSANDMRQVLLSSVELRGLLETVTRYVDDVVNGKLPMDNTIGRLLMNIVTGVPQIDSDDFEEMLNSNMKDMLMILYLAKQTRTQVLIHEKLTSVPLPESCV